LSFDNRARVSKVQFVTIDTKSHDTSLVTYIYTHSVFVTENEENVNVRLRLRKKLRKFKVYNS